MTKKPYLPKFRSKLSGWFRFSGTHWARNLSNGTRLDYWPTKDKFKLSYGVPQMGDVDAFISEYDAVAYGPPRWTPEEKEINQAAWYSYNTIDQELAIYVVHPGSAAKDISERVISALRHAARFYLDEGKKAA